MYRRIGIGCFCCLVVMGLSGCLPYYKFTQPKEETFVSSPVAVEVVWGHRGSLEQLEVYLDGKDVSSQFAVYDVEEGARGSLELSPGKHTLKAVGEFDTSGEGIWSLILAKQVDESVDFMVTREVHLPPKEIEIHIK